MHLPVSSPVAVLPSQYVSLVPPFSKGLFSVEFSGEREEGEYRLNSNTEQVTAGYAVFHWTSDVYQLRSLHQN